MLSMPLIPRLLAALMAGVLSINAASTPPKPLKTKAPDYPALKVKEPIAGTAVVQFTVGADGKVTKPSVKSADDEANQRPRTVRRSTSEFPSRFNLSPIRMIC